MGAFQAGTIRAAPLDCMCCQLWPLVHGGSCQVQWASAANLEVQSREAGSGTWSYMERFSLSLSVSYAACASWYFSVAPGSCQM